MTITLEEYREMEAAGTLPKTAMRRRQSSEVYKMLVQDFSSLQSRRDRD